MLYSEQIPDNLGIIFRKEYEDLRDSTVKDFEKYTGLKVDSHREVRLPNNSQILFRHIEELNNIQNVNLGWFAIEQGDELETDNEFFMLFGRLRRQVMPSGYFRDLGLPERSGFVICNAGEHWIKNLWKQSKLEDSELFEATTWDNADVLPKDFLDGLRILEKNKNEIYRQYVMNDWSVSPDQLILIPTSLLESLKELDLLKLKTKKIISCDPAIGGDECVVQVFDTGNIIEQKIDMFNKNPNQESFQEILIFLFENSRHPHFWNRLLQLQEKYDKLLKHCDYLEDENEKLNHQFSS